MRAQKEMRKMLLETGGNRILATQWLKTQLNCVLHGNVGGKGLVSNELGYLAEEIWAEEAWVESTAWFLLAAYSKM